MKNKIENKVFLGGHHGGKAGLGILLNDDKPTKKEATQFFVFMENDCKENSFDFDINSLTYFENDEGIKQGWWLIGKRGEIVHINNGTTNITKISTAGTGKLENKFGYLSQIRSVADELFICGYRRQVYQYKKENWELISNDILDHRAEGPWNGFESIDGFAKNNLYAVGDEGEIWHYNGQTWTQCNSPTNRSLNEVRCFNGKVWICGDGGIIISGNKNGWDIIWESDEPSESWWSIESYQDKVYVAGDDYLGVLENGDIISIELNKAEEVTTLVLHNRDGLLWSIGENDLNYYDGTRWNEI